MKPQLFISINLIVTLCAFLINSYLLINYNNECSDKNMFLKLRVLILLSISILCFSLLSYKLHDKIKYFFIVLPLLGIIKFALFANILFNFKDCEIYNSERVILASVVAVVVLLCSLSMLVFYFYKTQRLSFKPLEQYNKVLDSHKNILTGVPGSKARALTSNIMSPKIVEEDIFYDATDTLDTTPNPFSALLENNASDINEYVDLK